MSELLDMAVPTFAEMYGETIIYIVFAAFIVSVTTYIVIKLVNKKKKSK